MRSKVGKISAVLLFVIIITSSLFVINIVRAQNVSNITGSLLGFNNSNLTGHVLENITTNETVSDEILDNESDDWGDGNASEINGTVELVNITESNESISSNQTNETSLENETSYENITQNFSFNETNTSFVINETSQDVPDLIEGPVFDINLEYPQKITRGETIHLRGVATANSDVKNVVLQWIIPDDFTVSGSKTKECGDLAVASSCTSEIDVMTDLSSNLGLREIKIVVNYEE